MNGTADVQGFGGWCRTQAIIGNYAVPILEDKQVWGTSDPTRTAYLDTTDVARMTLASLRCAPHRPRHQPPHVTLIRPG